ncbi:MAG: hypothetical protein BAJALOKI3v1_320037 [Promethearchaeota archaeon]|jgi:hypothetical protein|nr:MAG: hypothetical protein BAJALOKI3v1_320037 [Candidatus Lokiarchaeota archaeon]
MCRRVKGVNESDQTYVSALLISLRIRALLIVGELTNCGFFEAKYNARKKGQNRIRIPT